jgi:hypothetical protein
MYENERESFGKLIQDLCMSVNRPFSADMLRVYWDDLQHVPFAAVERAAKAVRASGKKAFNSNDLRPPPEERSIIGGPDNSQIIARLDAHLCRYLWSRLSDNQRALANYQEFIWTNDRIAPRPVALVIKPDRQVLIVDGVEHVYEYPGHRISLADCDLGEWDLPRANVIEHKPAALTDEFDEAEAARDLLNRKGAPDLLRS